MRGFKCTECGSNRLHMITTGLSRRSEVVDNIQDGESLLCSGAEIFEEKGDTYDYYNCGECGIYITSSETEMLRILNQQGYLEEEDYTKKYTYFSKYVIYHLVKFYNHYFWTDYCLAHAPDAVGTQGGFISFDEAIKAVKEAGHGVIVT